MKGRRGCSGTGEYTGEQSMPKAANSEKAGRDSPTVHMGQKEAGDGLINT